MQSHKRTSRHSNQQKIEQNALVDRSDEDLDQEKILSQVSLEAVTEFEAKLEKQQLQEREAQKRQLTKLLHEQQQQTLNKKNLTGKDRLDFLLKQTEFYTQFLIQQRGLGAGASKDPELRQLQKAILQGRNDTNRNQTKDLSSKRKKKTKFGENIDSTDEKEDVLAMTRLEVQPSILQGGELRDYQLTSVNWLIGLYESGINGILADEMGLGKTVQTIAFLAFLREFKQVDNYFLIIVPKTVISNWKLEFKKWLPQCRVLNLIATKEEREEILKSQLLPGKFDVCLTTFEGVRLCMGPLLKFKWEYLIVDEAHKLKNEESQISQRLRQLHTRYRLLLTGTPLQNNLHELWSLLNFLLPEIFSSSADFDEWFNLGGKPDGEQGGVELTDNEKELRNKNVIEQLHRILRPFLLRRIKREVEKQLKPKVEIHVSVGITELQKSIYRSLLKQSKIEKGNSVTYYKNILIQLRKVCDHPYLFHNMEPDDAPELGEHIIKASGKMIFLDALSKKAKADGNQMLIFSGFTSMLDILEDFCVFRELKYCRLDGNTSLDDRESQIEEFVKPNSEINIFLISTRAGGLGLNLMTANIVVLYDSDWNPQMDLQAMDRAHRIGQTKIVQVFRLVTPNTMEEKMIERQSLKLKLDNMIIQKGRLAPKSQGLQKEEMIDMVNYGADAIFEVGDNLNDKDIETLIREGELKATALMQKASQVSKEKMNMIDFEMNNMNLYNFEDVDYAKQRRDDQNLKLSELVRQMITEDTTMRNGRRNKTQKNLSEANLCPKIFQGRNIGVSEETKKKKIQIVQDFRFFPQPERLKELIEKEIDAKYSGYFQGVEHIEFTEEEKIEKDALMERGFINWDRRDFQKFIQSLELYPKEDIAGIVAHIGTKTAQEVETYQNAFYANVEYLNENVKIKKILERCNEVHSFKKTAPLLIKTKVTAVERPLDEMVLNPIQKSKYFSKEADIVLLCLTHEYGYGKWTEIKHAIRRDGRVRFDHLLMSRNEQELQRRVDILVKTIEKEIENEQKTEKKVINADVREDSEMLSGSEDQGGSDVEMKQSEFKDSSFQDEEDEEVAIRVGNNAASSVDQSASKHDQADQIDIGEDDFEGLEEAAKIVLKKPRLN